MAADLTPEALADAAELSRALWEAYAATCSPDPDDTLTWESLGETGQWRWSWVARKAMDRLAPAHAALVAERDKAIGECHFLDGKLTRYRAALEAITKLASAAKPVMWWSGTRAECAWTLDPAAVTAVTREALDGGHG